MLARIHLQNFRSHKNTTIELHPGVNVIVGRGQAGKTNIKRGIEWLATNRPLGTKVHSTWMKKGQVTMVQVETAEGYVLSIRKPFGESVEYKIVSPDGKKNTFNKVGSKVPDLVTRILNIGELNVQGQLDLPYMVTSGTGEISRTVNKVLDLEIADGWIKTLDGNRHKNTIARNTLKHQQQSILHAIKKYETLPAIESALVAAEQINMKLRSKQGHADVLHKAINNYTTAQARYNKLMGMAKAEDFLIQAAEIAGQIKAYHDFMAIVDRVVGYHASLDKLKAQEAALLGEYIQLIQDMGACPTCYSPVSRATIKQIKDALTKRTTPTEEVAP